ncbi:MAG: hypothetical protein QM518_02425 [Verrucomicrobiota bacterium]|nr:hypothetical protein [Verrucomicrobiota bacterium]
MCVHLWFTPRDGIPFRQIIANIDIEIGIDIDIEIDSCSVWHRLAF